MAYQKSGGSFGRKPTRPAGSKYNNADRPDRSAGGEKKVFNRNEKSRPSGDDRGPRKSYGDAPRGGGYQGNSPRSNRSSDSGERPSFNRSRENSGSDSEFKPYRPGGRPASGERPSAGRSGGRSERPSYGDKPAYGDKPKGRGFSADRSERPSYGDKPKRAYGDRDARPSYGDRAKGNDRGERPSYGDKPKRSYGERDNRPSYGDRSKSSSDRGGYGNREDRGDRSERPAYGNRESRDYSDRPATPARTYTKPENKDPRFQKSPYGDVPKGKPGERNRSFKPEKEEYRRKLAEEAQGNQEATSADDFNEEGFFEFKPRKTYSDKPASGERPASRSFSERGSDRSSEGRSSVRSASDRSYSDKNSDRKSSDRSASDRKPADKKPYGSSEKREERDPAAPKGPRADRTFRPEEYEKRLKAGKTEKPERGGKAFKAERTERTPRVTREEVGEAPNYTGMKRYVDREKTKKANDDEETDNTIRLNRYIANAGICSRREADELIAAGEIKVNGEVVTELGYKVQPQDTVQYGKKNLNREKLVYVLLNKPKDFITTTEDPEGRKTVMDLVATASKERIFPVGRLDRNTTGLLLFTNDGELAQKLTHPSHKNAKIYQVELDKPLTKEHFQQITEGLELEDGKAEVDDLAIIGDTGKFVGIEIHIGKNRIVRRIFESLGYEVVTLDRVQYAGLTKKDLPRGKWRFLNEKEVIRLKFFL